MRLFWERSQRNTVGASFPSHRGAACFDFGLRPPTLSPSELISSGLVWFWTSSRSGTGWEKSPVQGLPETRSLTRLSEQNAQAFVDDFRDNCGSEGRDIVVMGIDAVSERIVHIEAELRNALYKFAREGLGPIQMVAYMEDDGDEVIYTTWPLSEPVRSLLGSWLIRSDEIRDLHSSRWKKWQTKWLESLIAHVLARAKS